MMPMIPVFELVGCRWVLVAMLPSQPEEELLQSWESFERANTPIRPRRERTPARIPVAA